MAWQRFRLPARPRLYCGDWGPALWAWQEARAGANCVQSPPSLFTQCFSGLLSIFPSCFLSPFLKKWCLWFLKYAKYREGSYSVTSCFPSQDLQWGLETDTLHLFSPTQKSKPNNLCSSDIPSFLPSFLRTCLPTMKLGHLYFQWLRVQSGGGERTHPRDLPRGWGQALEGRVSFFSIKNFPWPLGNMPTGRVPASGGHKEWSALT